MLANYLKKIRTDRLLSESARASAVSNLGANWEYSNGALHKKFLFPSYEGANNFMLRYNNYCSKINRKPKWQNVFNGVTITLTDDEFNDITTKEIEVAKYLEDVYEVTLNFEEWLAKDLFESANIMLPQVKQP